MNNETVFSYHQYVPPEWWHYQYFCSEYRNLGGWLEHQTDLQILWQPMSKWSELPAYVIQLSKALREIKNS